MKVINWKPYNKGKLRGFFDVLTGEGFTIKGFKIMEGINGEFVSRPSQQDKNELIGSSIEILKDYISNDPLSIQYPNFNTDIITHLYLILREQLKSKKQIPIPLQQPRK